MSELLRAFRALGARAELKMIPPLEKWTAYGRINRG